jgi:putative flippase GtrA
LYNFIYDKQVFDLGFIAFTPHIAAFFTQLPITFCTGFWLNRYVSFSESELRGRIQIVRYLMIVIACILINYAGLKLFVEVLHIYPTPSQMLNTVITTIFSFFSQKYFSFKA